MVAVTVETGGLKDLFCVMCWFTLTGLRETEKLQNCHSFPFVFCVDEWRLELHLFLANQIWLDIEFQKKNDLSVIYQPGPPFGGPFFAEKSYSIACLPLFGIISVFDFRGLWNRFFIYKLIKKKKHASTTNNSSINNNEHICLEKHFNTLVTGKGMRGERAISYT